MKSKYLKVLSLSVLMGVSLMGCQAKTKVEVQEDTVVENQTNTQSLLYQYNEDGVNHLKAYYPTLEGLEFALKNIGNELGDLTLTKLDGTTFDFSELKNQKIMIEINQDGCSYCKANEPVTAKVLSERDDVIHVPVFLNSTVEGIKEFYKELNLEMPKYVLIDNDKKLVDVFHATSTPTTIFVDENNKISYVAEEVFDETSFNDALKIAFENEKIYEMKQYLFTTFFKYKKKRLKPLFFMQ